MSALVHPADGLYATSVARLVALGACHAGRRAFSAASEHINADVPGFFDDVRITLSLLASIMEIEPCLGWLIDAMYGQDWITYEERDAADRAYWREDWGTAGGLRASAEAVMDLLSVRAKREGLVAS